MDVQAHLAPALATIHNFIQLYDPDEILNLLAEADDAQLGAQIQTTGDLALGLARAAEKAFADNYESLNANLRLVFLTQVSEQKFDP